MKRSNRELLKGLSLFFIGYLMFVTVIISVCLISGGMLGATLPLILYHVVILPFLTLLVLNALIVLFDYISRW